MAVKKSSLDTGQSVLARIRSVLPELSPSERRVADYVLEHSADVIHMTVLEVSEAAASGQSTIIRWCRTLGLSGFQELKIQLARDTQSIGSYAFDQQDEPDDSSELHSVLSMSLQAFSDARSTIDARAFELAVERLCDASQILIFAYGSSQIVAQSARDQFTSIGLRADAPQFSNMMFLQANTIDPTACALIISHSGATTATIQYAEILRERGVPVIALTSYLRSPLAEASDIVLAVGSQELQFRFEYLSARLVHLAVINSLYLALAKKDPVRARRSLDLFYEADSTWRI